MPIEVVCAIIRKNNLFLACQRSANMSHPLQWEFPGGKLKEGETKEGGLKREIAEELQIKVTVEHSFGCFEHSYSDKAILLHAFVCSFNDDKIQLTEHANYKWFHLDDWSELDWVEADLKIIRALKAEIGSQ